MPLVLVGAVGVVVWASFGVSSAAVKTTPTLAGTWSCCGAGGAGAQNWVITAAGTGNGSGGGQSWPIHASLSGTSATIVTGPYVALPAYTATFKGTLADTGHTITGTWSDTYGQSGTFTATGGSGSGSSKPPLPPSDKPTGRLQSIEPPGGGVTVRRGGVVYSATENSQLQTGDIITTDSQTLVSFEFLIGGRVGINSSTSVEMINDRAAAPVGVSIIRTLQKNWAIWSGAEARALQTPNEIQTNGGVMGVRG